MNVPVYPLYKANKIKRLVVSTYQAVSGAGAWGLWELDEQIKAYAAGQPIKKNKFPHQIVNNIFSHNSAVQENGYNEEENKMVKETRKIFGDAKIAVTGCVAQQSEGAFIAGMPHPHLMLRPGPRRFGNPRSAHA